MYCGMESVNARPRPNKYLGTYLNLFNSSIFIHIALITVCKRIKFNTSVPTALPMRSFCYFWPRKNATIFFLLLVELPQFM